MKYTILFIIFMACGYYWNGWVGATGVGMVSAIVFLLAYGWSILRRES